MFKMAAKPTTLAILACALVFLLGHVTQQAEAADCNIMCMMVYMPVCGSDGHTYSNSCMLGAANCGKPADSQITVAHSGACST